MIKIFTLGNFDITVDDYSIMEDIGSHKRLIKLFKYFLINNNTKLLPENIIEDLYIDQDFKNPLNMLRTQISRLRKNAKVKDTDEDPFFSINYVNGYYIFQLGKGYMIDFIEFEKRLDVDFMRLKKDIKQDSLNFKELLLLYQGPLMEEEGGEDWIIPTRSKYDRLYVKGLSYYIDYLKENSMYTEIIDICEEAIKIKPYEETIHHSFMEALINLDQHSYALIHYEFFTKKLFNDLEIVPSKETKEIYKKIKNKQESNSQNIDLNKIDEEMLKSFNFTGVMFCGLDYFKFMYNYERRNKERNKDTNIGIGIITLESRSHKELTERQIDTGAQLLEYTLFKTLRFGDIVTTWNNKQVIMLLYGLGEEGIESVASRINNYFDSEKRDDKLGLRIKINIL
ncbi:MAG: bacterial transcriptional activator domain-containing protein [Tissierella sp.]|uniref:bacterial transcriptional activator domain-containing protein n=1 Tax=Tissierella sp. TaxID=41274 RepID=UPI003F94C90F